MVILPLTSAINSETLVTVTHSVVSFPDPFRKWKGGFGKQSGVEMYTVEC